MAATKMGETMLRQAMMFRFTARAGPASAFRWLGEGLRLLLRAPISLIVLCLVPLVVELVLQQIPYAGVVVSKLVVPCVGIGLWYGIDELARGGRLRVSCLTEGVRAAHRSAAITSVVTSLIMFATQVAVSVAVYGAPAVDVLLGRPSSVEVTLSFALVTILPAALPLTLVGLSLGFAAFDGLSARAAIVRSVREVLSRASAFAPFMLAQAALLAVALVGFGIPLLVVSPWLLAAEYVAYRDVRASRPPAS